MKMRFYVKKCIYLTLFVCGLLCVMSLLRGFLFYSLPGDIMYSGADHKIHPPVPQPLSGNIWMFPRHLLSSDRWSSVDAKHSAYVFNAYYTSGKGHFVDVISAVSALSQKYQCVLWYETRINGSDVSSATWTLTTAKIAPLHISNKRYVSCRIRCPLLSSTIPDSVTIKTKYTRVFQNLLLVKKLEVEKYLFNFTVCVAPLHFNYNRAYELVEFIELNRLLGADRFIFYKFSVAPNANQVLHEYSKRGLAEVVEWSLPIWVDQWPPSSRASDIQYFGQTAQLNDCLLRIKSTSRYLVNEDLDEFIIPKGNDARTWHDILVTMPDEGAYYFRNAFFRKEWGSPVTFIGKHESGTLGLITLLNTFREAKTSPVFERAKYIARTDGVVSLETHFIHEFALGMASAVVEPEIGLLHHYRNWKRYGDHKNRTLDLTVVTKYKNDLIGKVKTVWSTWLDGVDMGLD